MPKRLLHGQRGWWLLGPAQVALLPDGAVTSDGLLTEDVLGYLEQQDFFVVPENNTYYLTVLTATNCNLGCSYCFQNTSQAAVGRFNPPRIAAKALTPEITEKILRFASANMEKAGSEQLHILLFGGEPLLNTAGALHLLDRAAELGLQSAEMVTNGTLLTARLAQRLAAAGLTRLQITFDGDPTSHDQLRVTRNGRPTFDRILRNITAASTAASFEWIFRVNVADPPAADIPRLLASLKDCVDPSQAVVSLHLLDDVGVGYTNEQTYASWVHNAKIFTEWYAVAAGYGFNVPFPRVKSDCMYCSEKFGKQGAVVNADGVLYSCWESAGKPGWDVGDVETGYLAEDVVAARWVSCGFEARSRWTAADQRQFSDVVDAANLELSPLVARGRE